MAVASAGNRAIETMASGGIRTAMAGSAAQETRLGNSAAGRSLRDDRVNQQIADGVRRDGERGVGVVRRSRIDGLALGAPVTAAFVGVLLAKGELGGPGAAGAEAAVTPAQALATGDAVAGEAAAGERAQVGADEQASLEGGARQAALDPVAAAATAAGGGQAAPAEGGEGQAIPDAAAADPGGTTLAAGGAITINMAGMAVALGEGGAEDNIAGDQLAPIGAWFGGTDGDDTLVGTDRHDHLEGGAGNDVIHGLGGDDWLDGGSGDDAVYGGAGADTLLGGTGDDLLDGGTGDDLLRGGDGHDQLFGGAGNDRLEGGTGDDMLDGGSGTDRLFGGSGNDVLIIHNRSDLALEQSWGLDGGGWDTLQVAEAFSSSPVTFVLGHDLSATAAGISSDRHQVHSEIENLVLTGSAGHDALGDGRDNSLTGNAGNNALYGFAGDDLLQGGAGDDLLDGGPGDDRLEGGAGDDILLGGAGDDSLWGGDGDDLLQGGPGADLLYGGAGNDTYVIGLNDHAVDTVFDHEGSNHIVLNGYAGQKVQAAIVDGDLHIVVDANPVAVVSGYVGHEASFAGVDLGAGIVAVEELLVGGNGGGQQQAAMPAEEPEAPADLLESFLSQPTLIGSEAADHLVGSDGADWLSGGAGDDVLIGGAGDDVLEGGAGSDLLQGGAGNDRYLFRSGESGLDTIRDAEGSNIAELIGFTGARLEGVVVGHDLVVVADYAPIFKVENYAGNEAAFAGVQVGDSFVSTEELFS